MKTLLTLLAVQLIGITAFSQYSGNLNYQTQVSFPTNNINVPHPPSHEHLISVKGMANVKADNYVAIFNVAQVGKTAKEVNELIDERINGVLEKINAKEGVTTFVDMISFVPVYTFEKEKKVFSKRTYTEIPSGFELKKNLHIKFTNPNMMNELILLLSQAEIYDLIRVDYFSNDIAAVKKQLMKKAKETLLEKYNYYESVLDIKIDSIEKFMTDGFRVVLPVEMYKSYQAYSCNSLNLKKNANVNQASKSTTLYYQPVVDKEFDFVLNPTILEPVIQVMYEVKIKLNRQKSTQTPQASKEILLLTPSGEVKNIKL